jgi:deoxyadenosine/deoxycytidine kinase
VFVSPFWAASFAILFFMISTQMANRRRVNIQRVRLQQSNLYEYTWHNVLCMVPADTVTCFVFLDAPTETLTRRMRARGRESEKAIDVAYIESLSNLHREWIAREKRPVYTVNADQDEDAVLADVMRVILHCMNAETERLNES